MMIMSDDFYQNREYIKIAKNRKAQIVFWCIRVKNNIIILLKMVYTIKFTIK